MAHTDFLPSGEMFAFWEDGTEYQRTYHVAQRNPLAADVNPGTESAPLLTIAAATRLVQPGEKVVVHEGIYRETLQPLRGGESAEQMIAFQAAAGERVVIRGSECWSPQARPSSGYKIPAVPVTIWMADLPALVTDGYNPFALNNCYLHLAQYGDTGNSEFMHRVLLRRGLIFMGNVQLRQVYHPSELAESDGVFWVAEQGERIHFRLPQDIEPAGVTLEVTAREQLIAPREHGLGYLRISGFYCDYAADALPVPQRAAVSTSRGHHWIIEGLDISHCNACGMDIGVQSWDAEIPEITGHHVIRRNHIQNCGVCGIAGALGVHHTLVENNIIEEIGSINLEQMWECAGIKFHLAENSIIRNNILRHIENASGIWLDCRNVNNRITENLFLDILCRNAAIYMEMNFHENCIDSNIIWDIRDGWQNGLQHGGNGLRADSNEHLIVEHNFFGNIEGYATNISWYQAERKMDGRTGLCRGNKVLNNVYYHCPHRTSLGQLVDNICDGNLFDIADDAYSFNIANPAPAVLQNLASWQQYFGLDSHSRQGELIVNFDINNGNIHWQVNGEKGDSLEIVSAIQR